MNFRNIFLITAFLLAGYTLRAQVKNAVPAKNELNLAGVWSFQTDAADVGVQEKWFAKKLADEITLPGSMLTNGKGNDVTVATKWTGNIWDSIWYTSPLFEKYRQPGNTKITFWLQPEKHYVGVAWYQKKVNIPANFKSGFTELFLERCHWETAVWIDGNHAGMQNSLAAAHSYDVGKLLTPGIHTVTIRIDNRIRQIDPGADAHSISDNTQTNWNGIVGKMVLLNKPGVYISNVALFPNAAKKIVEARVTVLNGKNENTAAVISLQAKAKGNTAKKVARQFAKKVELVTGRNDFTFQYQLDADAPGWDEYDPNVLSLKTTITTAGSVDETFTDFGLRDFEMNGTRFTINGTPIFLRGTLECAIFPKTGFPPTDVASWEYIYKRCKEYGLNHVRFHSWCPPEAAFIAADKSGIYLSIEASAWVSDLGDGDAIDRYIYEESDRIVKAYGNHPSFVMLLYGNEARGKKVTEYLSGFLQYWKSKNDNRQKYSSASGFPENPESQFISRPQPRIQRWAEGLKSIINAHPPSTDYDWTDKAVKDKPTVSHEIGQWCVYPDFNEIKKYTGPLKASNFEVFRDLLDDNGMRHLADSFLLASGKLQMLCYKADIEAALRTKGFAGFQLLDLHDFPGQGTATVGVVNAFWEDKPYASGSEYKQFCNDVVPLARMKKLVFENSDTLLAQIQVANFTEKAIRQNVSWAVTDDKGGEMAKGVFAAGQIPVGNEFMAGTVSFPLATIRAASKLKLTVAVGGYKNSWDFFVYPKQQPAVNKKVIITQQLDAAAMTALNNGESVLLTLKKGSVLKGKGGEVQIGFSSIFWNTAWTSRQAPTTLGILCNPSHPVFNEFPTQYHSNYQWWDAMTHSSAIRMDEVDKNIQPILRVIDDWYTAKPLGLLFECKAGKGKLLVSGVDLVTEVASRPEARQLRYSLELYMGSNRFNPSISVDVKKILSLTEVTE
jgi:hypothetical protein